MLNTNMGDFAALAKLVIFIIFRINGSQSNQFDEKGANGLLLPKPAVFHFPEYAYKETSKNEIIYHELETLCERNPLCDILNGIAKISCVRRCVSHGCYQDIYGFDELEEGEIDVRLNSFKGCVIQRTTKNLRRYSSTQGLLFQRYDFGELIFHMKWKITNFLKKMF
ncbi:uncharacterized protein [Eurosta solidaginis]|uniref:uncharacterized protein n=1 Tax=Eurosta solidaginis TaxID=178769 RepID=UPI003530E498